MTTVLNCKYLYSVIRTSEDGKAVNKSVVYVDLIDTEFSNPQPSTLDKIEGFNKTCTSELTEFAQGSILFDIKNNARYVYAYLDGVGNPGTWLEQV